MSTKKTNPFLFVILSAIGLILLGTGLYGYSLSYQPVENACKWRIFTSFAIRNCTI